MDQIIPSDANLESWNADYLQRNHHYPIRLLGAAEAIVLIRGESNAKDAVNIVMNADPKTLDPVSAAHIKDFIVKHDADRVDEFRQKVNAQFPYNDDFKSEQQLDEEKKAREETRSERLNAESDQSK